MSDLLLEQMTRSLGDLYGHSSPKLERPQVVRLTAIALNT
jgi:hypothetical protein